MTTRRAIGLGIAATLVANVAQGLGHGLIGAAVAAWPAVALVDRLVRHQGRRNCGKISDRDDLTRGSLGRLPSR